MYNINALRELNNIGFRMVGRWTQTKSGIGCELNDCADDCNILYCFVSGQTVLYIGKTTQSLKKALYEYQNPGPTQNTNIKVNKKIIELLDNGKQIDIVALPDNGSLHSGAVRTMQEIEDKIIKSLNPMWNQNQ